jgi:hypothetical protein
MAGRQDMNPDDIAAKQDALLAELKRAQQSLNWATRMAAEIDYDGVEMATRAAAESIGEFVGNADNWRVDTH